MKNPTSEWQKLKDVWNGKHGNPATVIVTAGGVCLLAYMLFSVLPLFIPGADFSHLS